MTCGGWGYVRDGDCSTGLYMSAMVRPVGRMAGEPVHTGSRPFLEDIIMFVPITYKIKRIIDISEFLRKYGIVLAVLLGIGIIALTVCLTIR